MVYHLNFIRLLNLGGRRNSIEKNIIRLFGISFSNYNISKQNSIILIDLKIFQMKC